MLETTILIYWCISNSLKLHPNEFIATSNLSGSDLESIRGSNHKHISVVCK